MSSCVGIQLTVSSELLVNSYYGMTPDVPVDARNILALRAQTRRSENEKLSACKHDPAYLADV